MGLLSEITLQKNSGLDRLVLFQEDLQKREIQRKNN